MKKRKKPADARLIITSLAVAMPLEEAMMNYIDAFSGNANTRRAKRLDCDSFMEMVRRSVFRAPLLADVTAGMIQKWCRELCATAAPSTAARRLATIKHFCNQASAECEDWSNPARNIKTPRIIAGPPKSLSKAEVAKLLLHARNVGNTEAARVRNYAIVLIALVTGLRNAELCDLQVGQLTERGTLIRGVKGKGQVYSDIWLNDRAVKALQEWLEIRESILLQHDARYPTLSDQTKARYPIFISGHSAQPGAPLTYRMNEKSVWRVFSMAGDMAGIEMHPHKARHTFARRYYEASGKDIVRTCEAMRHANVNTTMRYAKPTEEEVRAVYQHV